MDGEGENRRNGEDEVDKGNELESLTSSLNASDVKLESNGTLDDVGPMVYGITENPPVHILLTAALQQALLGLAGQLPVAILVADVICAEDDDVLKARILSSTLFMDGLTTVAMVLLGSRLPIFQGASLSYVVPLLMLGSVQGGFCHVGGTSLGNGTHDLNQTTVGTEAVMRNLRSGSLMLAGVLQAMMGLTGLVGALLRFVGPITLVPSMLLGGIYMAQPTTNFAQVHWGIAALTIGVVVVLSLYLEKWQMPLPLWTPAGGFRIVRFPLHQMFSILIAILFGWMVSGILTRLDVFSDDPKSLEFNARTDARTDGIKKSNWFIFPYPGQFGGVLFSSAGFVAYFVASIQAILDSVADYYACARVCHAPPPPPHAVNRGILVEGLCSFLSGAVGCGHGTNSYGGNIGAIGITKVASRGVFVCVGLIYILFGVVGKFSAVFVAIPYPVLGGAMTVIYGIYIGVVISNLEVVSLSSSRNIAIIGLSLLLGLMLPGWVKDSRAGIQTGSAAADNLLMVLIGNPTFPGTLIAFFLDNTVPGSARERGLDAWHVLDVADTSQASSDVNHGGAVYDPYLIPAMKRWKLLNYIPFLPNAKTEAKLNVCEGDA